GLPQVRRLPAGRTTARCYIRGGRESADPVGRSAAWNPWCSVTGAPTVLSPKRQRGTWPMSLAGASGSETPAVRATTERRTRTDAAGEKKLAFRSHRDHDGVRHSCPRPPKPPTKSPGENELC